MPSQLSKVAAIASILFVFAQTASAHPSPSHVSGFAAGVTHPLSGLDHLLAMIAVGLYAAQRGGRAMWLLPATFLLSMAIGGMAGLGGHEIPVLEQGIAASVLVLGLMVAAGSRLPLVVAGLLISVFALFHGYAHGVELKPGFAPASYAIGFILATAMLHAVGMGLGVVTNQLTTKTLPRIAGGAIAICGVALFWL